MTPKFITQYSPLTARPFLRNSIYEEHIPCKLLRPYVSCFWSSEGVEEDRADWLVRVIPDTCMDIIIDINYTKQTVKSQLCGIQDYTVIVEQGKENEETIRFAVRFPFFKRFHGLWPSQAKLEALKPNNPCRFSSIQNNGLMI